MGSTETSWNTSLSTVRSTNVGAPLDSEEHGDIEGLDYLFLGNFSGRGKYSLETICLLFALKLKHPSQVHILRGCMEDIRLSKVYGLADECQNRLGENPNDPSSVFNKINKVFDYLPLAATILNKVFCMSSGIGSTLTTIDEINKIKRPLTINYEGQTKDSKIVLDLLWSDPVLSNAQIDTRVDSSDSEQRRQRSHCAGSDRQVQRGQSQILHVQKQSPAHNQESRVRYRRYRKSGWLRSLDCFQLYWVWRKILEPWRHDSHEEEPWACWQIYRLRERQNRVDPNGKQKPSFPYSGSRRWKWITKSAYYSTSKRNQALIN